MWTDEVFGVKKPIIALLHIRALPGDPDYDKNGGMQKVLECAKRDLDALQTGGVDGILFANEFSTPYQLQAPYALPSAMAWVIGRLGDIIDRPFGVNVVYNPLATVDLAAATGAKFARSAFSGCYTGEYGLMNTDPAAVIRRKYELGIEDLKLLYKLNPESDSYLVPRDFRKVAKSIIGACYPDALCVSGDSAGADTSDELLSSIFELKRDIPVFCNTGCNINTVEKKLSISDGACVGTTFKTDGKLHADVEVSRVIRFMSKVKEIRARYEQ